MKHLPLFILALAFLIFFPFTPLMAQDFDASKALSDYLYNINLYRAAYLEYSSSKNEYLTYQTLTSQNKALESTKKLLNQRAVTVKTYLTAVRMKLKESTSILNYDQNYLYIKIDDEITWIPTSQAEYNSAGTLEDLVNSSIIFEERYPGQEALAFRALGQIVFQEESVLKDEVNSLIEKTEKKIAQMRETGEDTSMEERWLIQAKEKVKRSDAKGKEALGLIANFKADNRDKLGYWNQIQGLFEEENQYLKEACSNLREIIREVKSAQ